MTLSSTKQYDPFTFPDVTQDDYWPDWKKVQPHAPTEATVLEWFRSAAPRWPKPAPHGVEILRYFIGSKNYRRLHPKQSAKTSEQRQIDEIAKDLTKVAIASVPFKKALAPFSGMAQSNEFTSALKHMEIFKKLSFDVVLNLDMMLTAIDQMLAPLSAEWPSWDDQAWACFEIVYRAFEEGGFKSHIGRGAKSPAVVIVEKAMSSAGIGKSPEAISLSLSKHIGDPHPAIFEGPVYWLDAAGRRVRDKVEKIATEPKKKGRPPTKRHP